MTNPYSPITTFSVAIGFMLTWMGFLLDLNTVGPNTGTILAPGAMIGVGLFMMIGGGLYGVYSKPSDRPLVFSAYSSGDADMKRMADAVWFNTYILQPQQQADLLRKLDEKR